MHRIDTASSTATLPSPLSVGPHPNGYFEQRGATKNGTLIDCDYWNSLQEEICNVIETAFITLDKSNNTQLYNAILNLIEIGIDATDGLSADWNLKGFKLYSGVNLDINSSSQVQMFASGYELVLDLVLNDTAPINSIAIVFGLPGDSVTAMVSSYVAWYYLLTQKYSPSNHPHFLDGFTDFTFAANTTHYVSEGNALSTYTASASDMAYSFVIPFDGTLSKLKINYPQLVSGSGTYTFTLIKEGVASALTVADTTFTTGTVTDSTHTVSVVAGDMITLRVVLSVGATPITKLNWSVKLEP